MDERSNTTNTAGGSSFKRKGTIVTRPASSQSTAEAPKATADQPSPSPSPTASRSLILPVGTKGSVHNRQILVSTGFADLDDILGGGLPLGSFNLVVEDHFSKHAYILLRYLVAEGVSSQQKVYLCAPGEFESEQIVKRLPYNTTIDRTLLEETPATVEPKPTQEDSKLKIAWQYQKYIGPAGRTPATSSQPSTQKKNVGPVYCHSYDLSQTMQPELLEKSPVFNIFMGTSNPTDCSLKELYTRLAKELSNPELAQEVKRVVIPSFSSPVWGDLPRKDVFVFVQSLRRLCRTTLSVCVMSASTNEINDDLYQALLLQSDCVLEFSSFAGEKRDTPAEFSDFHGLLRLEKLPCYHSYVPHIPESLAYGCKVRRKKMTLEKLHPPPEGESSDPPSRSGRAQTSAAMQASGMGCSSTGGIGPKNPLDF